MAILKIEATDGSEVARWPQNHASDANVQAYIEDWFESVYPELHAEGTTPTQIKVTLFLEWCIRRSDSLLENKYKKIAVASAQTPFDWES
jgi:hypothetical protein